MYEEIGMKEYDWRYVYMWMMGVDDGKKEIFVDGDRHLVKVV